MKSGLSPNKITVSRSRCAEYIWLLQGLVRAPRTLLSVSLPWVGLILRFPQVSVSSGPQPQDTEHPGLYQYINQDLMSKSCWPSFI